MSERFHSHFPDEPPLREEQLAEGDLDIEGADRPGKDWWRKYPDLVWLEQAAERGVVTTQRADLDMAMATLMLRDLGILKRGDLHRVDNADLEQYLADHPDTGIVFDMHDPDNPIFAAQPKKSTKDEHGDFVVVSLPYDLDEQGNTRTAPERGRIYFDHHGPQSNPSSETALTKIFRTVAGERDLSGLSPEQIREREYFIRKWQGVVEFVQQQDTKAYAANPDFDITKTSRNAFGLMNYIFSRVEKDGDGDLWKVTDKLGNLDQHSLGLGETAFWRLMQHTGGSWDRPLSDEVLREIGQSTEHNLVFYAMDNAEILTEARDKLQRMIDENHPAILHGDNGELAMIDINNTFLRQEFPGIDWTDLLADRGIKTTMRQFYDKDKQSWGLFVAQQGGAENAALQQLANDLGGVKTRNMVVIKGLATPIDMSRAARTLGYEYTAESQALLNSLVDIQPTENTSTSQPVSESAGTVAPAAAEGMGGFGREYEEVLPGAEMSREGLYDFDTYRNTKAARQNFTNLYAKFRPKASKLPDKVMHARTRVDEVGQHDLGKSMSYWITTPQSEINKAFVANTIEDRLFIAQRSGFEKQVDKRTKQRGQGLKGDALDDLRAEVEQEVLHEHQSRMIIEAILTAEQSDLIRRGDEEYLAALDANIASLKGEKLRATYLTTDKSPAPANQSYIKYLEGIRSRAAEKFALPYDMNNPESVLKGMWGDIQEARAEWYVLNPEALGTEKHGSRRMDQLGDYWHIRNWAADIAAVLDRRLSEFKVSGPAGAYTVREILKLAAGGEGNGGVSFSELTKQRAGQCRESYTQLVEEFRKLEGLQETAISLEAAKGFVKIYDNLLVAGGSFSPQLEMFITQVVKDTKTNTTNRAAA